jgi:hypothetical protein
LNLQSDFLFSNFVFTFNLYRYSQGGQPADGEVAAALGGWRVTPEAITALSPVSWDSGMLLAGTTGGNVEMLAMVRTR